jgi:ParB family chromosome partitioning protein
MSEKRRGLGRGLGALITSAPPEADAAGTATPAPVATVERNDPTKRGGRPVDVFFPENPSGNGAANKDDAAEKAKGAEKPAAKRPAGKRVPMPNVISKQVRDLEPRADVAAEASTTDPTNAAQDAEDQPVQVDKKVLQDDDKGLIAVPGTTFAEIPVDSIHANRKQPRNVFDEDDMAELVHSIREIGVLQPIVVRPSAEGGEWDYELVMGERRWRATREAGLTSIPAIIRETADDDLLRDALLENLHRSQLNPLEEAAAYQQLLDDFGCTHDELSERIGRSRPQISNTLRLLRLPPLVQRRLAAGVLSAGHARALLGLGEPAEMEKLAQRIVAEGLSVRATEEIVALSGSMRRPARESKPRAGARHERLDYLANSLSDRLDTSVKITLGARKGKVSIEFASVDDLNRIMGVINPENRSS